MNESKGKVQSLEEQILKICKMYMYIRITTDSLFSVAKMLCTLQPSSQGDQQEATPTAAMLIPQSLESYAKERAPAHILQDPQSSQLPSVCASVVTTLQSLDFCICISPVLICTLVFPFFPKHTQSICLVNEPPHT